MDLISYIWRKEHYKLQEHCSKKYEILQPKKYSYFVDSREKSIWLISTLNTIS
jgi:hypothetical protein